MYSTNIYLIFVLITTTCAGVLPKSRRPLSHNYRNGFVLGQIELRDPSLDSDNLALRKSEKTLPLDNDTSDLFGKYGIIILTNPRIKNDLLNKIAAETEVQYLRLREPDDQENRSVEVDLPEYRRAVELPKLVYDFNRLVG
ncbi:hypothetical protein MSG28_014575 [Choristoneura fumiferana]|uniref:Uncharacterized protein n=1 Tax=Choristoneura fumiferana TaxID=7141 RepID=A0ACC0JRV6_CHOFU|nr:hypothetical protein MSG28_014575 [Choristoneura fumiferana]